MKQKGSSMASWSIFIFKSVSMLPTVQSEPVKSFNPVSFFSAHISTKNLISFVNQQGNILWQI